MKRPRHGLRVVAPGLVLGVTGFLWAWAPIRGLCPEHFRSVDAYHLRLVTPAVTEGSVWDRTWPWAVAECRLRVKGVTVGIVAYSLGGLICLGRQRDHNCPAHQPPPPRTA